jgi:exopolysaccharide production protein ExoQ
MSPTLALSLWVVLVLGLLYLDPAKAPKVSVALWIPLTWIFFMASRPLSLWLNWNVRVGTEQAIEQLEQGDPLNRAYSSILLLLGIIILASRSIRWGRVVARNRVLIVYLIFALASVLWSDFPGVAFKRWFRDLGNYVMILVVLSDPRPVEALGVLLRRLGYLLIPLSVVFIKYFPDLGRQYDPWTGAATYCGVATSKNMLGELCLVCGIYFFWDTVVRWPDRKSKQQKRVILVNAAMICMIIWLLNICDSATSRTCLIIAFLIILAAHSKAVQRGPAKLTVAVPIVFLVYMFLFFVLGLSSDFANAVGRTSLSGRNEIWKIVLSQQANPLLGAGYESFWMGPRLERIWAGGMGRLNESHNGYLEAYLNLGYIGITLLLIYVGCVYRYICKQFKPFSNIASLALAIWTAFLFHSCTEADFRSGLMWVNFVLAALAVAQLERKAVYETAPIHIPGKTGPQFSFKSKRLGGLRSIQQTVGPSIVGTRQESH